MSYDALALYDIRTQMGALKPIVRPDDVHRYACMRDAVIMAYLPHTRDRSAVDEQYAYKRARQANDGYLEQTLYGRIWQTLLPNERLAVEHLYYDDPFLVAAHTGFYASLHRYAAAKNAGHSTQARIYLRHALWEILYNFPYPTQEVLERDKAKKRRKAQAQLLNSLNIPTVELTTPDYVIASVRAHYRRQSLETLLPDIVFPLDDTARAIANDIQQINADIWQQMLGQKSQVTHAQTREEATGAFAQRVNDIVEDVRSRIDATINGLTLQAMTAAGMIDTIDQDIAAYQDTTVPQKMHMLATHFNGKLTEFQQREAGYSRYIWHSQDDPKVRPEHAANDGKVFSWDTPPPTGHPGEHYNCRCYAEPYHSFEDLPLEPVEIEIIIPIIGLRRVILEGGERIGKSTLRIFRNPVSRRPKGVPKDWKKIPSKKKKGYKYVKLGTKGNTDVRVQKGTPRSSNPSQHKDYVKWKKAGKWLDKNGKEVLGDSPEAHIPLDDFKFDKDIFK